MKCSWLCVHEGKQLEDSCSCCNFLPTFYLIFVHSSHAGEWICRVEEVSWRKVGWAAQVINACGPHRQWEGVEWVLKQIQSSGVSPNSTTYGLAIEVRACPASIKETAPADTLGCGGWLMKVFLRFLRLHVVLSWNLETKLKFIMRYDCLGWRLWSSQGSLTKPGDIMRLWREEVFFPML